MFDPMECMAGWAAGILGVPVRTYPTPDSGDVLFCVIERTGGDVDYPHDWPEVSLQAWARTDEAAETAAYLLAIAARNENGPNDTHVLDVGVPSMYSYGREDGGWYIWQVTMKLACNLID